MTKRCMDSCDGLFADSCEQRRPKPTPREKAND